MREKYTQRDVQRLVEAAEDVVRSNIVWYSDRPDKHIALNDSLKPFRPDPESLLIEELAKTLCGSQGGSLNWNDDSRRGYFMGQAIKVLRIIKDKGHYKEA